MSLQCHQIKLIIEPEIARLISSNHANDLNLRANRENKNNPRYFEFFIPTAYYYTELYNNKDKAREYIELFESKKIC